MTVTKSLIAFTLSEPMILRWDVDSQEIVKEYHDCKQELESSYTYITDDIAMPSSLARSS